VCCWEHSGYRGWLGVLVITLQDVVGRGGAGWHLTDDVELLVWTTVTKILASF
jgi:hypothetical protein